MNYRRTNIVIRDTIDNIDYIVMLSIRKYSIIEYYFIYTHYNKIK